MADETGELDAWAENILKAENRYYQEVAITKVRGACPYGLREGDTFRVTALDSGGLCGSLLAGIMPRVVALHYGAGVLWEPRPDAFTACCPEGDAVEVSVRRRVNTGGNMLAAVCPGRDMTGRGYAGIDRYRIFMEVQHIEGNCMRGHRVGDRIEIDPFNVSGLCCLLYNQLYPYLHVLLSGATPPWATQEHSISAECPDTFNRLCFRLSAEERHPPGK